MNLKPGRRRHPRPRPRRSFTAGEGEDTVGAALKASNARSGKPYGTRGREHRARDVRPSIGSVGDAYDNALMETINGLCKAECIRTKVFHEAPGEPSPTSSTPPLPGWDWA